MSVSKSKLVAEVADAARLPKAQSADAVEALLTAILDYAAAGEKVIIQGFGTFEMKTRAARTGRNPATGLPVDIPAKTMLTFKPAKLKG